MDPTYGYTYPMELRWLTFINVVNNGACVSSAKKKIDVRNKMSEDQNKLLTLAINIFKKYGYEDNKREYAYSVHKGSQNYRGTGGNREENPWHLRTPTTIPQNKLTGRL